jgi:hypothetical protein
MNDKDSMKDMQDFCFTEDDVRYEKKNINEKGKGRGCVGTFCIIGNSRGKKR